MRLRIVLGGVLCVCSVAVGQTGSNATLADRVCGSTAARVAAQKMEAAITKDPAGQQALALAGVFGMKAEAGEGQLFKMDSVSSNRAYPGKTADSFLCQGEFVHRNTRLTPQEEADAAAKMTAAMANEMLVNHQPYFNHYQVTPLGDDRYRLRLIPEGLQLSKEYTSEFAYR